MIHYLIIILTLSKSISNDENRFKRLNVQKITSLKDLFNCSIKEITLNLSSKSQLEEIRNFFDEKGETIVNINISNNSGNTTFKLKNLRNVDRKSINILRNKEISLNID